MRCEFDEDILHVNRSNVPLLIVAENGMYAFAWKKSFSCFRFLLGEGRFSATDVPKEIRLSERGSMRNTFGGRDSRESSLRRKHCIRLGITLLFTKFQYITLFMCSLAGGFSLAPFPFRVLQSE